MQALLPLFATVLMSSVPVEPPPQISLNQAYPTVGKAATITTPELVEEITITYRPDAPAVKIVETVTTGGTKHVVWWPLHPGVVKIEAGGLSKEISVRFDGVPMSGVFIMLLAGAILFGGAFWSMRQLMND